MWMLEKAAGLTYAPEIDGPRIFPDPRVTR